MDVMEISDLQGCLEDPLKPTVEQELEVYVQIELTGKDGWPGPMGTVEKSNALCGEFQSGQINDSSTAKAQDSARSSRTFHFCCSSVRSLPLSLECSPDEHHRHAHNPHHQAENACYHRAISRLLRAQTHSFSYDGFLLFYLRCTGFEVSGSSWR